MTKHQRTLDHEAATKEYFNLKKKAIKDPLASFVDEIMTSTAARMKLAKLSGLDHDFT